MEFSIKQSSPEKQRTGCVVVGVYQEGELTAAAEQVDRVTDGLIGKLVACGDVTGKSGSSLMLSAVAQIEAERVLLVGLGKKVDFSAKGYLEACRTANAVLQQAAAKDAAIYLCDIEVSGRDLSWKVIKAVQATADADHRSDGLKSEPAPAPAINKIMLALANKPDAAVKQALQRAQAIAHGRSLCKDLGNLPGNICTPSYLAETAVKMAKQHKLKVTVLDEAEMDTLGMYSLLSVAQGSDEPAKLIALEYKGADKKQKPVVLVGKGVTFDSGGISIKPGAGMDEMKYDMCGAASVLGTMQAVAEMKLKLNLVVIVPATENLPNGKACKPGDVVTSMSGQTIEILNTDAEGRLILCDALTYAAKFKPETVIDVATLTGACVIALGNHATGLYANDDALADDLQAAGETALDRAWRMPLWDDYQKQLDSNFADMQNIGGREGGSITAACFLSRFTRDYRWAHLDIAGTAWLSGKAKGATARPVPLLTQYLMNLADSKR